MRIDSEPPGLVLVVDGQSRRTPAEVLSVPGSVRKIGVLTPQQVDQANYQFESWSDGGAPERELVTPADDTRLVMRFRPSP